MPYYSNQYNYATPLSSAQLYTDAVIADAMHFTLHDNSLDGSYHPISGDVGIWGTTLSDSNGHLSVPLQLTIEHYAYVTAFSITGSSNNFPVDFSVAFYNGEQLIHTLSIKDNTKASFIHYFDHTMYVSMARITITKVSAPNSVAKVYSTYYPTHLKRSDSLNISVVEQNITSQRYTLHLSDKITVGLNEAVSSVRNTINVTKDTLVVRNEGRSVPTNVHTRMKEPSRKIYGKVYITYTDPMLESDTIFDYSSIAYNSNVEQLTDNVHEPEYSYFTLYDNNLTGEYRVMDESSQVGWTSAQLSNADGIFDEDVWVAISFEPRPVESFIIAFDTTHGNIVKDFAVILVTAENAIYNYEYHDNNEPIIEVTANGQEIKTVTVMVVRVAKPNSPATIISLPLSSTLLYRGYKDVSELISIDLLEELTYEDEIEALGGVSANEVTVALDNSNHDFYYNSYSLVSKQLKRNRKIAPWLGVEIVDGIIEWYSLGTFWSYKWDVPTNGLAARVVGFDTIGLLDTTSFVKHRMLTNASIAELIRYVLDDAKTQLNFIEYVIDPALEDVIIPYAWFENKSHTAALRKISLCYPMHIYCDRQGRICAAPQKLKLDYHYDTWSNSTNVIDKNYSSLYTTLPNIINVSVVNPTIVVNDELAKDETVFSVPSTKKVAFNKPCLANADISVDCDSTVAYTYEEYSWGVILNFTGTGVVRSIVCTGNALDTSNVSIITETDEDSVRLNGSVTRDISSPFIQTIEHADTIISRIKSLSETDKYDASVDYRGDIALTINDPILLKDGIAPSERYNIKRHQLFWDGGLSGSAELNT